MGGLRDRVASLWQFKSLIWGISSGFLLANHLICLVQNPYLLYLRVLLYVHPHLLVKMDSTEEAYGNLVSLPF